MPSVYGYVVADGPSLDRQAGGMLAALPGTWYGAVIVFNVR